MNVVRRSLLILSGALLLAGAALIAASLLGLRIDPHANRGIDLLAGAAVIGAGFCLLPAGLPPRERDEEDDVEDGMGW